jgi:hypothetical protein
MTCLAQPKRVAKGYPRTSLVAKTGAAFNKSYKRDGGGNNIS